MFHNQVIEQAHDSIEASSVSKSSLEGTISLVASPIQVSRQGLSEGLSATSHVTSDLHVALSDMDQDQKEAEKPFSAPSRDLAVSNKRLPRKRNDITGKPPTDPPTTCIYRTPPPRPYDLYMRVPQSVTKCFKVVATFNNMLLVLVKYHWLDGDTLALLASMNPEWEATIVNVPKLMRIDFTLLLEEELNWQLRTEISKETVRMMDAAAVYYNADFGCVLRWLGGEKLAA